MNWKLTTIFLIANAIQIAGWTGLSYVVDPVPFANDGVFWVGIKVAAFSMPVAILVDAIRTLWYWRRERASYQKERARYQAPELPRAQSRAGGRISSSGSPRAVSPHPYHPHTQPLNTGTEFTRRRRHRAV